MDVENQSLASKVAQYNLTIYSVLRTPYILDSVVLMRHRKQKITTATSIMATKSQCLKLTMPLQNYLLSCHFLDPRMDASERLFPISILIKPGTLAGSETDLVSPSISILRGVKIIGTLPERLGKENRFTRYRQCTHANRTL